MKKINRDNFNEWCFEFLEGNCTENQKKDFLSFLETYPEYTRELEYWEKSFVREPLPPVLSIEKQLLKNDRVHFRYWLFPAMLLLFLAGVWMLIKWQPQEKITLSVLSASPEKKLENTNSGTNPKDKITVSALQKSRASNSDSVKNTVQMPEPVYSNADSSLTLTAAPSPVSLQDSVPNAEALPEKIVLSNKQLRKIKKREFRLKQKSIREKRAQKFMKGNTPYVVPVNPNAF